MTEPIVKLYKKLLIRRYDDTGYLKYFSAADFPGLQDAPFSFPSGDNRLSAHWYRYENDGRDLTIFCHGIGGGHRSYMKEIDALCRRGYTVLAYDNTGCFDSEGADIRCISQSLADLDAAVRFLKETGAFRKFRRVFVVGHSWGGYAAANIPAFQDGIEKAVVISGFLSPERLLRGTLGGAKDPLRGFALRRMCAYEQAAAPKYFSADALRTVNEGKTKYLFAHSEDDPTVSFTDNAGHIRENAAADVRFLFYPDRKHNPNYTPDAVAYLNGTFDRFNKAVRAGKLRTLEAKQAFFAGTDWDRMTAQDEAFWDAVDGFLMEE